MALQLLIMGLELQAVADRKLHIVGAAGRQHRVALGHADRHRFLADHMFLRPSRSDHMLRMQSVRRDDVDDINVKIFSQPRHRVIVINVFRRKAVLLGPRPAFFRRAGDYPAQLAILGELQRRTELTPRVVAKSA